LVDSDARLAEYGLLQKLNFVAAGLSICHLGAMLLLARPEGKSILGRRGRSLPRV
jgi:hypothetical protein